MFSVCSAESKSSKGLIIGVVALIVIAAAGAIAYKFLGAKPTFNFQGMEISKLTQTGKASGVAVSPEHGTNTAALDFISRKIRSDGFSTYRRGALSPTDAGAPSAPVSPLAAALIPAWMVGWSAGTWMVVCAETSDASAKTSRHVKCERLRRENKAVNRSRKKQARKIALGFLLKTK